MCGFNEVISTLLRKTESSTVGKTALDRRFTTKNLNKQSDVIVLNVMTFHTWKVILYGSLTPGRLCVTVFPKYRKFTFSE